MICQEAGSVIAEAKREDLLPYLGLHYPATDIPEPARELYRRCKLRFIPDMNVRMVELIPNQTLDLSHAVLRSFNNCCVEYHKNMGVAALLVIALVKEQQLWGLISCHHETPKYLSQDMRKMYEFLGQLVSLELAHKVNYSELDYQVRLKFFQSELIETISQANNFIDALIEPEMRLLNVVSATGVAVCLGDEITLIGATPDTSSVQALTKWVDPQVNDNLFYTESLPKLYPEALAFKETASGLLLLRISQIQKYYILWFRPEVLQTVNWAGNPNGSIQVSADGSMTLCPRKSFASWQEIVN
ncbi:MAG: GAF domain-containing protein [Calothrix sp. SM1_7_51]|nr:GAF domain-containing protein [Calothrix sp. SM1_7_51]